MSQKVSQLPAAGVLDRSELMYLIQAGASKKIDLTSLFTGVGVSPQGPVVLPPDPATLTWDHQGSAQGIKNADGSFTLANQTTQTGELNVLYQPATPPFTFTVKLRVSWYPTTYNTAGIILRDNSGLLLAYGYYHGPTLIYEKCNSTISANSGYTLVNGGAFFYQTFPPNEHWLRFVDDGTTNRTVYISQDGTDWVQVYQVARNDFMTPTNVGVYVGNWAGGNNNTPRLQ